MISHQIKSEKKLSSLWTKFWLSNTTFILWIKIYYFIRKNNVKIMIKMSFFIEWKSLEFRKYLIIEIPNWKFIKEINFNYYYFTTAVGIRRPTGRIQPDQWFFLARNEFERLNFKVFLALNSIKSLFQKYNA
jgi:hypothetical protein